MWHSERSRELVRVLVKLVEHKAREVSDFRGECFDRFMTGSRNFWIFGKNVTRCATFCRYLIKVYTLSRFIFVKKKGKKESNKDSPISVLPLDRYKLIHRSEWDDESHSKKIRYLKCFSPIWYVNRSGGLTKRTYRMEKRKEKKRPFINEIAHCFAS